jgi:hypothetical protein
VTKPGLKLLILILAEKNEKRKTKNEKLKNEKLKNENKNGRFK